MSDSILAVILFVTGTVYAQNTDFVTAKDAFDRADFQAATVSFEKACQAEPKNADAQFWLGRSHLQLEDYDNAIDHLENAIEINDSDASFHMYYAMALARRVRESGIFKKLLAFPKVKREMESAVRLAPENADYREALGELYADLPGLLGGSEEKARVEAFGLERIDPYQSHLLMARIHQRNRNFDSAETELRKAISHSPAHAGAHIRLAYHYEIFLKDSARAIHEFKHAISVAPNDAGCHDDLGVAYFEAGSYDESISEYNVALAKNPNYADAIFHLGQAYEMKFMYQEALDAYARYLALGYKGPKAEQSKERIESLKTRQKHIP